MAKSIKAKPCRYCGNLVAPNARRCPNCDGKKPCPPTRTSSCSSAVVLLILLVVVVYVWANIVQLETNTRTSAPSRSTTKPQTKQTSPTEPPRAPVTTSESMPLPAYQILDTTITEDYGKTMVLMDIQSDDPMTEDQARLVLEKAYENARTYRKFKYHSEPTVIAVCLFSTAEHQKSAIPEWFADMTKRPGNPGPIINIYDKRLAAHNRRVNEKQTKRFGLTYEQRRTIWRKLALVGYAGAKWEHGEMVKLGEKKRTMSEDEHGRALDVIFEKGDQMRQRGENSVRDSYGLSDETIEAIRKEAEEMNWPMPEWPYEDIEP